MMTAAAMKKIEKLSISIKRNTARVGVKISRRGNRADRAMVISGAKYYEALKKLAER